MRRLLAFLTFALAALPALPQQNNLAFEERYRLADTARFAVVAHSFSFFRNLEWFNPIADGKTLFGQQLAARALYRPAPGLLVSAGVYVWQDFGNARLQAVRPVYTLRYEAPTGRFAFNFGTLEGHLAHRQLEPMLDFERVITHRLEQGMQCQWTLPRLWADVWVDWQNMIYRYDKAQERISGGATLWPQLTGPTDDNASQLHGSASQRAPAASPGWRLFAPLQGKAYHQGGQLDTNAGKPPLASFFSGAAGLRLVFTSPRGQAFLLDGYAIGSHGVTTNPAYPSAIRDGHAWYANAQWANPVLTPMLSYYEGRGLYVPGGGQLYQSLSSQVDNAPRLYTERRRRLLILRLQKDFSLPAGLSASIRAEPYEDLDRQLFEYSYSLYLNWQPRVFLR